MIRAVTSNGQRTWMIVKSVVCCVSAIAFATSAWSAEKPAAKPAKAAAKAAAKSPPNAAPPKQAAKAAAKPAPKTANKSASKLAEKPTARTIKAAYKPAPVPWSTPTLAAPGLKAPVLTGKRETLTCRDGTEDRHARIGVVLIGGKVDSFAYYSKWKPRTCSIYLERNRDAHSRWLDKGNVTNVNLERGLFLIEHNKNEYRFVFRDVDRERYCGMDGTINGTLTIRKGTERCEVAGIMEEGTPLGQAYAQAAPAAPTPATAAESASAEAPPPKRLAQRFRRESQSAFPSAAVGISD